LVFVGFRWFSLLDGWLDGWSYLVVCLV
jgi:hypothetical protein